MAKAIVRNAQFGNAGRISTIYILLGVALLLPATTALALQMFNNYRSEADDSRLVAISAADTLVSLSDARALSDLSALQLLSRSRFFVDGDLVRAAHRAQDAVELLADWRAVVLQNRSTGEVLFEATADKITKSDDDDLKLPPASDAASFGDVERDGVYCPCVYIRSRVPGGSDYVLVAVLDPIAFQRILVRELPEGAVAGIVDKEGEFLARSLDYFDRVGTPGTSYVIEAVGRGGRGIYEGRTYEGLINYTAYATSEITGWSSHVAIDRTLLDRPSRQANRMLVTGVSAAIASAVFLFFLAWRETRKQRRAEERLIEMQRTEAVSQFTATIVHDFRNVISAVTSGLNIIKRKTGNDEIKQDIDLIHEAIARGARLANQILSLSHSKEEEVVAIDVPQVLQDLRYLLEQAAGQGVELELEVPESSVKVIANKDQLELALINLVVNAKDAIGGNGRVSIRTIDLGSVIEIWVADTGPGVPEIFRRNLFTPFATSKPHGTGLGLAQVAGMARKAGGDVRYEQIDGHGATFVISLPTAKDSANDHETETETETVPDIAAR